MITEKQIIEVQKSWGEGLIKIGSLKDNPNECEYYANKFIDELYAFNSGEVLFKPTKCETEQFRQTKSKALSEKSPNS